MMISKVYCKISVLLRLVQNLEISDLAMTKFGKVNISATFYFRWLVVDKLAHGTKFEGCNIAIHYDNTHDFTCDTLLIKQILPLQFLYNFLLL
jgi:hypothetical protein